MCNITEIEIIKGNTKIKRKICPIKFEDSKIFEINKPQKLDKMLEFFIVIKNSRKSLLYVVVSMETERYLIP